MAGVEYGRRSERVMKESVLIEGYRKKVASHVLAIQNQFDSGIAKEIGFSGSVLNTMQENLVTGSDNRLYVQRDIPDTIRRHLDKEEYGNVIFDYSSYNRKYKIQPGKVHSAISMASESAELDFSTDSTSVWKISAKVKGSYNWSNTADSTERSMLFSMNSKNSYEVLRIGQKKDGVEIAPLVYGDLDASGNAHLHLDQPINAHGAHITTDLTDGLIIRAKDKKFYYPLSVNWQHELADISGKLLYE